MQFFSEKQPQLGVSPLYGRKSATCVYGASDSLEVKGTDQIKRRKNF